MILRDKKLKWKLSIETLELWDELNDNINKFQHWPWKLCVQK